MAEYQMVQTYLAVLVARFFDRVRDDERGRTAEEIVLIGVGLLGAAACAGILWLKLKGGANDVTVPAPAAP